MVIIIIMKFRGILMVINFVESPLVLEQIIEPNFYTEIYSIGIKLFA